jgi:S-formylglutathione hydrolase FrmB
VPSFQELSKATERLAAAQSYEFANVNWSDPGSLSHLYGVTDYLGCSPLNSSCASTADKASAITGVSAKSPPTLLATSDQYRQGCEIVPPQQTDLMAAALKQAGRQVVVHVNQECAHAYAYYNVEGGPTLDFFRQVFRQT